LILQKLPIRQLLFSFPNPVILSRQWKLDWWKLPTFLFWIKATDPALILHNGVENSFDDEKSVRKRLVSRDNKICRFGK
jgi:hypothetical protein